MKECSLSVEEQVRLAGRITGLEKYIEMLESTLVRKQEKNPGVRTGNMQRLEVKIARARRRLENKRNDYRKLCLEV